MKPDKWSKKYPHFFYAYTNCSNFKAEMECYIITKYKKETKFSWLFLPTDI